MNTCYYCDSSNKELRPYGPGGSWVCFACAMETPGRAKATEQAFGALLDANLGISPVVAIGSEEGPVPFNPEGLNDH